MKAHTEFALAMIYTEFALAMILILSIVMSFGVMSGWSHFEQDKACEDIGFEAHKFVSGMDICTDSQGDYHLVEMTNTNIFHYTDKEVSFGDVRTI